MKSARLLLSLVCGITSLALFSGCETQRAACERERRMAERFDEMQMAMDGRMHSLNSEMAAMRANPPVVVQQVPMPMPSALPAEYHMPPPQPQIMPAVMPAAQPHNMQASMNVDTISIEDDLYNATKRQQLEQLASQSRQTQLYNPPSPKKSSSASASGGKGNIRVPVPARTVQAALKEAGFYKGALDGKVGKQTIDAISAFQRAHNLKADGIVGRQTWQLLYPFAPAGMSTSKLK